MNSSRHPKQAKKKRNDNIVANKVARWAAGERETLWEEAVRQTGGEGRPQRGAGKTVSEEKHKIRRKEEVISLARRGLPGKAVQHAASLGIAPDTAEVEAIMRLLEWFVGE